MNDKQDVPPIVTQMVTALRANRKQAFRLRWQGTKIPRGASVDGIPIAWTQHGVVRGGNGETLGYYGRTLEFGGPSGDEHEMIIETDGEVTAGVGQTVERVRDFDLSARAN